jgi:hypothetical protein
MDEGNKCPAKTCITGLKILGKHLQFLFFYLSIFFKKCISNLEFYDRNGYINQPQTLGFQQNIIKCRTG